MGWIDGSLKDPVYFHRVLCARSYKDLYGIFSLAGSLSQNPYYHTTRLLKVKFKRFVQGSQKFCIYANSIKQKRDFNSCYLYSKKAKYLNSDFKKGVMMF